MTYNNPVINCCI